VANTSDQPSWQLLLDAIATETDERRRSNLEIVAKHVVFEVAGDVVSLVTTLTSDPVYRFWGPTDTESARGTSAVTAHYEGLIASGKNRLDYDISRVIVDEHHVVTEGDFHFAYPGTAVREIADLTTEQILDDARYLVATHCLIIWPIDASGLIKGEDLFAGERPRVIRRLSAGEMPHLGLAV
jgi:hypothetical protein